MMFFVCFGNDSIFFLHYFQKNEDDLFPKNTPKDDIFAIAEKDDTHLRKKVFLAF